MVIANYNNNHANDDDIGRNNDNDGEDQNAIVTEDEDSIELENNRNIDEIKEKLCNEWIGSIASREQNEYYATKLVQLGFDSVAFIENCIDFEDHEGRYRDAINFMDPVHKQVFVQNVTNLMKEKDNDNNEKSIE